MQKNVIDNLAKIEKELDDLKPSVAGLADDIDPNTDYGKLISSITSKNYDEIDWSYVKQENNKQKGKK